MNDETTPPIPSSKSQTLKEDQPIEEAAPAEDAITPLKQSFQQNNQEAIERNEELMSLLACLNEQAIKELNT